LKRRRPSNSPAARLTGSTLYRTHSRLQVGWFQPPFPESDMTPEDAFLLDILAHPSDSTPRLVYADWLLDQGDPRADWIRQGCRLLAAPPHSSKRRTEQDYFRRDLALQGHTWPEMDGLVLTWENLVSVFRYRVAETIAWCSGRGLPLRSNDLLPGADLAHGPHDWRKLVQRLALGRSRALTRAGKTPRQFAQHLAGGRLLLYLPRHAPQLDDRQYQPRRRSRQTRTAEPAPLTEYLDASRIPAWDTWLAFGQELPADSSDTRTEGYLVAWVPEHLVVDVEQMIHSKNSQGNRCLLWAEELDVPFLICLRKTGLIG
jgi:uncharacterized protein (TIGR02996 family)